MPILTVTTVRTYEKEGSDLGILNTSSTAGWWFENGCVDD
jgi:hypothetical protein